MSEVLPKASDRLPLLCRLCGHGWKPQMHPYGGWVRKTCRRCRRLDVPTPN